MYKRQSLLSFCTLHTSYINLAAGNLKRASIGWLAYAARYNHIKGYSALRMWLQCSKWQQRTSSKSIPSALSRPNVSRFHFRLLRKRLWCFSPLYRRMWYKTKRVCGLVFWRHPWQGWDIVMWDMVDDDVSQLTVSASFMMRPIMRSEWYRKRSLRSRDR